MTITKSPVRKILCNHTLRIENGKILCPECKKSQRLKRNGVNKKSQERHTSLQYLCGEAELEVI